MATPPTESPAGGATEPTPPVAPVPAQKEPAPPAAAPPPPAAPAKPAPPAAPRKPRRGLTAAIIIVVVLVLLLVWTVLSPSVPDVLGATARQSPTLGRTGNSTVEVGSILKVEKFYGGNVTWEVIIKRGAANATAGVPHPFEIIVSKQAEHVSSFFKGTSPHITEAEVNTTSEVYSGNFTYYPADEAHPYVSAVLTAVFPAPGTYTVTVHGKFTVDQVMLVGFLPADSILFTLTNLRIVVS